MRRVAFGYHPKMGGYPDLFNHLLGAYTMNAEKTLPSLAITLAAVALTLISGLAAQLCRIGHGGIVPVGVLTPFAALLFLRGGFDVLPLWIAILQFPVYALSLLLS